MATMSTRSLSACRSVRVAPLRAAARAPAAARRSLIVVADSRKAVVVLTGTAGVSGEVVFTQEGNGALCPPRRRSEHRAQRAHALPPACLQAG